MIPRALHAEFAAPYAPTPTRLHSSVSATTAAHEENKRLNTVNISSLYSRTPRILSERLRNISIATSIMTEPRISSVAAARIVGLICSRMPDHICRGTVRCSTPPRN